MHPLHIYIYIYLLCYVMLYYIIYYIIFYYIKELWPGVAQIPLDFSLGQKQAERDWRLWWAWWIPIKWQFYIGKMMGTSWEKYGEHVDEPMDAIKAIRYPIFRKTHVWGCLGNVWGWLAPLSTLSEQLNYKHLKWEVEGTLRIFSETFEHRSSQWARGTNGNLRLTYCNQS